jgi:hypothetical protein
MTPSTPRVSPYIVFPGVLAALILLTGPGPAAPTPGTPDWFAHHVFDGQDGCLAVRKNLSLKPGDQVLVFAADTEAVVRRITNVIDGDTLKTIFDQRRFDGVYADRALWARIGCYWGLGMRDDPPALAIARYEPCRDESPSVLAVDNLPRSALAHGGNGRRLGPQELSQLEARCASFLPRGFSNSTLLLAGRCFESVPGHKLVELLLGRPFGGAGDPGAVIDSVQIVRFFLDNGTVLCSAQFSRVSGQEERVDTEAPQLTSTNWYENWDDTLGFLSFDRGATWSRLSVSVGFEGFAWAISELAPGMPELWSFYLYTSH